MDEDTERTDSPRRASSSVTLTLRSILRDPSTRESNHEFDRRSLSLILPQKEKTNNIHTEQ
jgi:hypothetical protein